jgi:hypothetical protein
MVLERFLWKGLNVKIVFVIVTVVSQHIQIVQGCAPVENVTVILRELK